MLHLCTMRRRRTMRHLGTMDRLYVPGRPAGTLVH